MKNKSDLKKAVLNELNAIAFSDFTRFVSLETIPEGGQVLTVTDTALLSRKDKRAVCAIKAGTKGIEVKLHDKLRALELLGKSCGAVNGGDEDEEIIGRLQELFEKEGEVDTDG